MKTNYHSHTSRCFHATGEDEQYVLEAIKNNYDVIGFSDHMPVPGIEVEPGFKERMGYSKRSEYVKSVLCIVLFATSLRTLSPSPSPES